MKKAFLVCAALLALAATTACISGKSTVTTYKKVSPIQITEIFPGVFPSKQYASEAEKNNYSSFEIDTNTLFHRCVSETMLVGYALVPTGFDTLFFPMWLHGCDFARFKQQVTLDDVRRAETLLAKSINKEELDLYFCHIKTRYRDYGRQYVFFYNKAGDLCVMVNCSCEKHDWLFSRRYTVVCDGGDCYWRMVINLDNGQLIYYNING